ncbi:MAG: hypothetical protein LBV31_01845 [Prevotellaceae bacterium]|nr:hypothetical protein [Prevotellaceae bacterium]
MFVVACVPTMATAPAGQVVPCRGYESGLHQRGMEGNIEQVQPAGIIQTRYKPCLNTIIC